MAQTNAQIKTALVNAKTAKTNSDNAAEASRVAARTNIMREAALQAWALFGITPTTPDSVVIDGVTVTLVDPRWVNPSDPVIPLVFKNNKNWYWFKFKLVKNADTTVWGTVEMEIAEQLKDRVTDVDLIRLYDAITAIANAPAGSGGGITIGIGI